MTVLIGDRAVAAYWRQQSDTLVGGVDRLRRGDLTAVHPTRVAVRRLRSTLRTFRAVFDPGSVQGLAGELRWLALELSEVRDRQVLLELFDAMPEAPPEVAAIVSDRISAELAEHAGVLSGVILEPRVDALMSRMAEPAQVATVVDPPGLAGHLARGRELLARRLTRARRGEAAQAWHDVRKAGKRVRYAAELVAGAESGPAGDGPSQESPFGAEAATMEALQELLGRVQDLSLAEDQLDRAVADGALSRADASPVIERLHRERRLLVAAVREWDPALGPPVVPAV